MDASITNLEEYRKSHPPVVRCVIAMHRAWLNWSLLPVALSIKILRGMR